MPQYGKGSVVYSYYDENNEHRILYETDDGDKLSYTTRMPSEFKNEDFTFKTWPKKTKIIHIDNVPQFDSFTRSYGKYDKTKDTMYIDWKKVSEDFRGFYMDIGNKDLIFERYDTMPYFNKMVGSWWKYEYNTFEVILFDE